MDEQQYLETYRKVFLNSISEPIHYDTDLPPLLEALADLFGRVAHLTAEFPLLRDVDEVSDEHLQYLVREFLPNFPFLEDFNYREFIKESKAYYSTKGTEIGLEYVAALSRLVFRVWEPSRHIFRLNHRSSLLSGARSSRPTGPGVGLARIRDGILWSQYTYVIEVGNLRTATNIDSFLPLIDLNHPAGTKYFLNFFYNSDWLHQKSSFQLGHNEVVADYLRWGESVTLVCEPAVGGKFILSGTSTLSGKDRLSGLKPGQQDCRLVSDATRRWINPNWEELDAYATAQQFSWLHEVLETESDYDLYANRALRNHPPIKSASLVGGVLTGFADKTTDGSPNDYSYTHYTLDQLVTEANAATEVSYWTTDPLTGDPLQVVIPGTTPDWDSESLRPLFLTAAHQFAESDWVSDYRLESSLYSGRRRYPLNYQHGMSLQQLDPTLQQDLDLFLDSSYHSQFFTAAKTVRPTGSSFWNNLLAPPGGVVDRVRNSYQPSANIVEIVP